MTRYIAKPKRKLWLIRQLIEWLESQYSEKMIRYPFGNIRVMGMPNVLDVQNPYILGSGVKHIINVSEKSYPKDVKAAINSKGIACYHFPLSEKYGKDWSKNLRLALSTLDAISDANEGVVVHCGFGNNRSRTVVEAFYYLKTGMMYEDEYKGYRNHLFYNIAEEHFSLDDIRLD